MVPRRYGAVLSGSADASACAKRVDKSGGLGTVLTYLMLLVVALVLTWLYLTLGAQAGCVSIRSIRSIRSITSIRSIRSIRFIRSIRSIRSIGPYDHWPIGQLVQWSFRTHTHSHTRTHTRAHTFMMPRLYSRHWYRSLSPPKPNVQSHTDT